jgi:hypothetical protein
VTSPIGHHGDGASRGNGRLDAGKKDEHNQIKNKEERKLYIVSMSPNRVTITLSGEQSRSGLAMILVKFVCVNRERSVKTKPSSRLCWVALTDVIIFRSS